jgi:hypothetical protein
MFVKERRKATLILCLLWAAVAIASFYLIEFTGTFEQDMFRGQETFWFMIVFSLLILILGLVIFFGQIKFFFPFIFFSKEDLLKYNVEKISFLLGILMVALSYVFTFITIGGLVFWIALIIALAIEVGALYAAASKKFEANI